MLNITGFLKVHRCVHTEERPYCWDVCNKTFLDTSSLKVHQHVHSGKRPYCCDVFNKTFRDRDTLNIHQCVHTWERPHHCDMCCKTFSYKCVLKICHLPYCNQQSQFCDMYKLFIMVHYLSNHHHLQIMGSLFSCILKRFSTVNWYNSHLGKSHVFPLVEEYFGSSEYSCISDVLKWCTFWFMNTC